MRWRAVVAAFLSCSLLYQLDAKASMRLEIDKGVILVGIPVSSGLEQIVDDFDAEAKLDRFNGIRSAKNVPVFDVRKKIYRVTSAYNSLYQRSRYAWGPHIVNRASTNPLVDFNTGSDRDLSANSCRSIVRTFTKSSCHHNQMRRCLACVLNNDFEPKVSRFLAFFVQEKRNEVAAVKINIGPQLPFVRLASNLVGINGGSGLFSGSAKGPQEKSNARYSAKESKPRYPAHACGVFGHSLLSCEITPVRLGAQFFIALFFFWSSTVLVKMGGPKGAVGVLLSALLFVILTLVNAGSL